MKLTLNNILFVKALVKAGETYEYHVAMKSHLVSDSRTYVNYDENGKTISEKYLVEKLPKTVQKFVINAATNGRWSIDTVDNDFAVITYR